jgi:HEAT repeat protein
MMGGVELRAAVQSMLARVGDVAVPALTRALDDRDPTVRRTAAGALGLNGSRRAIDALVERARAGSTVERAAVATQLANIAISGHLDHREVFGLAVALVDDPDPEVRRSVTPGLKIFSGREPRTLVDRLRNDSDGVVRKAAQGLPH